ncbi:MAG: PQQ-dependent sugar dehydrogenase, partial [Parcubacteria group bacterium]
NWRYAAILESDPAGTYMSWLGAGLRNSVFMTLHPEMGQLWATEMGRDGLGPDLPPDEINIMNATKHYGFPFCYGYKVEDTTFNERSSIESRNRKCEETEPAFIELEAHSAPLGLAFIDENAVDNGWPKEWENDLLVAYHGSEDASLRRGYKIVRFDLDDEGNPESGPLDFITGFLAEDGEVFGRPVDLKFDGNGLLYISDDYSGSIYRVFVN